MEPETGERSVRALAEAIESDGDQTAKLSNADPRVPERNRIQPGTVDDHLPDGTDNRTVITFREDVRPAATT